MDRPHLLFLAHRIPYPPNKGDKIRSWHLLRHLQGRYRVHLGAFVDDPADWAHQEVLAAGCESLCLRPLNARRATLRGLRGLVDGRALTLPYYWDPALAAWVREVLARHRPEAVLVYSAAMAQYVPEAAPLARRVIDFVDVDSDKWRQYAAGLPWYKAWVYRREANRLAAFERRVARSFDLSLFVSPQEAALFRAGFGGNPPSVEALVNGVDTDYFAPERTRPSPYADHRPALAFTGAMDYWPNVDAVTWFVRKVWPRIHAARPECRFHILGGRPTEAVRALAGDGVEVRGAVPDMRPWLQHAAAVVAPMRIARGIQNKVLEGMAMARPVITTHKGLEGIAARPGEELLVADTAGGFADAVLGVFRGAGDALGPKARAFVVRHHTWEGHLRVLDRALGQDPGSGV